MEKFQGLCGVWGTPALTQFKHEKSGTLCDSPRVRGVYLFFGDGEIPNLDDRVRVKLTSWIVYKREFLQKRSAKYNIPEVCSERISEAQERADLTAEERAVSTIEYLGTNSSELGTVLTIPRFNGEDASLLSFQELENKYGILYRLLCVSECADDTELGMVLNRLHGQEEIGFYRSDSVFKVMI